MSDSDVDTVTAELSRDATYVCLSVVVGEHHLGLNGSCSLHQLVWCHRVGLIAGQESDVDVFDS